MFIIHDIVARTGVIAMIVSIVPVNMPWAFRHPCVGKRDLTRVRCNFRSIETLPFIRLLREYLLARIVEAPCWAAFQQYILLWYWKRGEWSAYIGRCRGGRTIMGGKSGIKATLRPIKQLYEIVSINSHTNLIYTAGGRNVLETPSCDVHPWSFHLLMRTHPGCWDVGNTNTFELRREAVDHGGVISWDRPRFYVISMNEMFLHSML